jgi:hypothetical protein
MNVSGRIFLLGVTLAVVGCGGPSVDCNADTNKETAVKLIQDRLQKMPWYRDMTASLSEAKLVEVRTEAKDEKLGQAICAANYAYSYNDKPRSIPIRYRLDKLEDAKEIRVSTDVNEVVANMMTLAMFEKPTRKNAPQASAGGAQPPSRISTNAGPLTEAQLTACVDKKLAAYRKEVGADAVVEAPQLEEWEGQCKAGR